MTSHLYQQLTVLWDYLQLQKASNHSECILVFGGNDTRVAEHAAALYHQGVAPKVIVTGGKGRLTQHWQQTEAAVFADVLRDEGVPNSAIIVENQACHTREHIPFSFLCLEEKKEKFQKFTLVHKPYFLRYIFDCFTEQWPAAYITLSLSAPPIALFDYATDDFSFDCLVGDMLSAFDGMLHDTHRDALSIPSEVNVAYQQINSLGFRLN